jgi:hypothetical protein
VSDQATPDDKAEDQEESPRGTIELPRVVLGSDEAGRRAPQRRVLPGLVDLRWLSYPAYVAAFGAGGIAANFAIDSPEWSAGPVALAWMMLFFWEWIYGVAYHYRRSFLKYFSLLMVVGLSVGMAAACWERAQPQMAVEAAGGLVERGHIGSLDWAVILTLLSGLLISAHAIILGRGYREKKDRVTE